MTVILLLAYMMSFEEVTREFSKHGWRSEGWMWTVPLGLDRPGGDRRLDLRDQDAAREDSLETPLDRDAGCRRRPHRRNAGDASTRVARGRQDSPPAPSR